MLKSVWGKRYLIVLMLFHSTAEDFYVLNQREQSVYNAGSWLGPPNQRYNKSLVYCELFKNGKTN